MCIGIRGNLKKMVILRIFYIEVVFEKVFYILVKVKVEVINN